MNIANQEPAPDWRQWRTTMMLDPSIINLNTGSFGPAPRVVFDEANRIRQLLAAEPTHFFVRQAPGLLWEARAKVAAFLGTAPQRLIFTTNVSMAINIVANGLMLPSPGEILMSDHEYGAMQWCWERVAQRHGLTIRTFPLPTMPHDPGEIIAAATQAMTNRTWALFFSHVLSPTGMVLPAKELCAEARQRGIVSIVDGAHAPGMLPLNVDDVKADFYTGNLHKWVLGPIGTGFLAIGPGNEDRLRPLQVSWGFFPFQQAILNCQRGLIGADQCDDYGSTPRVRHLEFEGTKDLCPWLATPRAIEYQTEIGWSSIRQRMAELASFARDRFCHLKLATPATPGLHGSMTAFVLPGTGRATAQAYRQAIWAHHIEIPIIERPGRILMRISHHWYTLEEEIDQLAAILPGAIAQANAQ